jgi:hypothetical protein
MKHLAPRLLLALLCVALPVTGNACAILSKEAAAEGHKRLVEETKKAALALMNESDMVFVGRMKHLTFYQETLDTPSGPPQLMQVHQAMFDSVDNIKGYYGEGTMLGYTIQKNRVTIACTPDFHQSLPKENGAGELYLVYVRDGKILRTNHIPQESQVLKGAEEAALLRAAAK